MVCLLLVVDLLQLVEDSLLVVEDCLRRLVEEGFLLLVLGRTSLSFALPCLAQRKRARIYWVSGTVSRFGLRFY